MTLAGGASRCMASRWRFQLPLALESTCWRRRCQRLEQRAEEPKIRAPLARCKACGCGCGGSSSSGSSDGPTCCALLLLSLSLLPSNWRQNGPFCTFGRLCAQQSFALGRPVLYRPAGAVLLIRISRRNRPNAAAHVFVLRTSDAAVRQTLALIGAAAAAVAGTNFTRSGTCASPALGPVLSARRSHPIEAPQGKRCDARRAAV